MCTEPLYAVRLKTEYDEKFKRFGRRTPIRVLKAVRDIGKDTSKLDYDPVHYDLIMISCGQCMQCRLLRTKQRAVMCICESLEHKDNSFVTLTFGYPQTYSYYRHDKKLSHYLAAKKAHFHEWSLEVETFQKFMKRLRNWYYNYQLCYFLASVCRFDLIPDSFFNNFMVSHVRLPDDVKELVKREFKPDIIRCMHCGEYGSLRKRPHHHCILHGFQFPDLSELYEKGQKYYTSQILSNLWPFGIHRIGDCTYNSCAYVCRYVTKKINGNNQDEYYNGKKPEFITYSTKPVLGANYFIKNYKEIVNTQVVSVVADKKYECHLPKSYDNILKKIDIVMYNEMKEKRVQDCKTDMDKLFSQDRSIYSKLDSGEKIALSTLRKLVRGYEENYSPFFCHDKFDVSEYLLKAKAFGLSTKFFTNEVNANAANMFLSNKCYKDHKSRNTNDDLHQKYYKFELMRNRLINKSYNVNKSDKKVKFSVDFYKHLPNPYKVVNRGRFIPDKESVNENSCIDEKGKEYCYV